jgi:hypothetical protein
VPSRSADAELDVNAAVVAGRPKLSEKVRSILIRIRVSVTVRVTGLGAEDRPCVFARPAARLPRTVVVR